jgi:hypothetical protein
VLAVAVCEAMVVQVVPLRRCNETVPVNEAPLAVSVPVIEKGWLTWAEEGAEMVRTVEIVAGVTVGDFASIAALALQNNNAQITSTAATTITPLFSANIPPHLERSPSGHKAAPSPYVRARGGLFALSFPL